MTINLEFIPENDGGAAFGFGSGRRRTRISNDNLPAPRRSREMPHWLVFVISAVALGVPVAGLLFMVWLAVMRPADFVIAPVEVAYIAVATILIAAAMTSYLHRERRARL